MFVLCYWSNEWSKHFLKKHIDPRGVANYNFFNFSKTCPSLVSHIVTTYNVSTQRPSDSTVALSIFRLFQIK